MPRQPPASRMSLLRKERPAARNRRRTHKIVLDLISLQRRRQQLIHLDHPVRSAVRDANPQHQPVPHIQQTGQDSQHHRESNQPLHPFTHAPKYCTQTRVPGRAWHAAPTSREKISIAAPKPITLSQVSLSPRPGFNGGYSTDGWFSNDFSGAGPFDYQRHPDNRAFAGISV